VERFWKVAKWMFKVGAVIWFLALPLMPIYGWVRPWPASVSALRSMGLTGVPLMIGAGSNASHTWSNAGHVWRKQEQRSFVVLPESFRSGELFTYFEVQGSGIEGAQTGIASNPILIPLFVIWVAAGLLSVRTFLQLRERRPSR
jgi:hypothetical protein